MPKWVKVLLIVLGAGVIILITAGFFGVRALKHTAENMMESAEQANADGRAFGPTSTLDGCSEEGVHRVAGCENQGITCAPVVGAFLWGCLETAPYDARYCGSVPSSGDSDAALAWGRNTCGEHGRTGDDVCAMVLSTVAGFCESKKGMR